MSHAGIAYEHQPRILCVDDEPRVLEGLKRTLHRQYDVVLAEGPEAGLETVQQQGPFVAVVSDLKMPRMDGVSFLTHVRRLSPDSTRVLLTGHADLDSAIAAVNEGAIFRFLTKPCSPEILQQVLTAAVEQNRLVTAERMLLEHTLHGSIKALTDILAMLNPTGFGRAIRAKQLASEIAAHLEWSDRWQIEVAAMLSQIGVVTLPSETADKLYRGVTLTYSENVAVGRLPKIASELIANIPRMDEVAEILLHCQRRFDGTGSIPKTPVGKDIPAGARLLKLVMDFDLLETRGLTRPVAIDALRENADWYDPDLLDALTVLYGIDSPQQKVIELELRAVRPGMIFVQDVVTTTGILLIARGQEATERLVERLHNYAHLIEAKQQIRVIVPSPTKPAEESPVAVA